MTRAEVIERLCALQADVWQALDECGTAADCFCGKGGFWSEARYANDPGMYRNDGTALEFIEKAVRAAIAVRPTTAETPQ